MSPVIRWLLTTCVMGLGAASAAAATNPGPDPAEPLFAALRADDLALVRAALDGGAPIEARNSLGMTPLLRAAAGNKGEIVQFLLERGADLKARDGGEYLAFDLATERHRLDATLVLLSHWQAAASGPARAVESLALAAAKGDADAVTALIGVGTPVDAMGASGYTALALAARWGRSAVVDRLLAQGAQPTCRRAAVMDRRP